MRIVEVKLVGIPFAPPYTVRSKPRSKLFGFITFGLVAMAVVLFLLHAEGRLPGPWTTANSSEGQDRKAENQTPSEAEVCLDPARLSTSPPSIDANPPNYLHTCGSGLYDFTGRRIQITGVSWFGFETDTLAPHGLNCRNWKSLLDQVTDLGFNTIRLPYSNDVLRPGAEPKNIDYHLNPDLEGLTALELMDRIIQGARDRGLKVILDRHRPESWGQSSLWYTDRVSEKQWIDGWRALAARYLGNDTVIGVDLHNEPRDGATWGTGDPETDWRLAAERAGNAILDVNPYLLIFVQGIQWSGWDPYWWGGSLRLAKSHPVRLAVPGRLVYSPHDYGPGVYPQPWFWDTDFPTNLEPIWDEHWGYLHDQGIAPVVIGEFGGRSTGYDREGLWQRHLVDYMRQHGIGYLYWSLNPDSSDTGGLLSDDWQDIVPDRKELVTSYLAPPILADTLQHFGQPHDRVRAHYRNREQEPGRQIRFSLRIENDSPHELAMSELEVRYWLNLSELATPDLRVSADIADAASGSIQADVVQSGTGQERFLRLTFDDRAGSVPSYQMSSEIDVSIENVGGEPFDQNNDYSYTFSPDYRPWERITLYRGGALAWGVEPTAAFGAVGTAPAEPLAFAGHSRTGADIEPLPEMPSREHESYDYNLPPGVSNQVFLSQVEEPSDMAFAPDGRLFYAERRTGRIRIVENGLLALTPFYDFAVSGQPHTGLLGLTLDPDFADNHYVYAFYTAASGAIDGRGRGVNRVVRLTEVNGQGIALTTIVDGLPSDFIYNGGALRFGPDGLLYVGLGSGHNVWSSRDLESPAGKILRYKRDGTVPGSNPLVGKPDADEDIYAWGFSSPFSIAFHPTNGALFATDSNLAGDEINIVRSGENYGAPETGSQHDSQMAPPLASFWPSVSLTGATFYTGEAIPEWRNDLFVMNVRRGELRHIRLAPPTFDRILLEEKVAKASGFAVATGPDGALYYSSLDTIYRLSR